MKSMLLQRIRLLYVSGFVVSAVFMASCSDDDTDKTPSTIRTSQWCSKAILPKRAV